MTGETTEAEGRFSLVVGGPFHALLHRLGLTGADLLPSRRAALVLALLAWLPVAVLVVGQSLLGAGYSGWGFFTDGMAYTRYLLAIFVMVMTERYADGRLKILVHHFREAQILTPEALPEFRRALAVADDRSSSARAELVILVIVLIWSGLTTQIVVDLSGASWEGRMMAGEAVLSWAGLTASLVSTPLFLFLALRWIWRLLVWSALLYRLSRLPLQLTPLHPDLAAGLGFLAIFPSIFSGFLFALSAVVASAMVRDIGLEQHSAQLVWFAVATWMVLSVGLIVGPLLVFVRPLYATRETALIEYGHLASQHHLAFQRKWLGQAIHGEEFLGSGDSSSVGDMNAIVEAVRQMRLVPLDLPALLPLLVAAGVPMLAVVATQIPVGDMIKWLMSRLL